MGSRRKVPELTPDILVKIEARLCRDRKRLQRIDPSESWGRWQSTYRQQADSFDKFLVSLCGGRLQSKRGGGYECLIDVKWHTSTSGWHGAVINAVAAVRKQRGWV